VKVSFYYIAKERVYSHHLLFNLLFTCTCGICTFYNLMLKETIHTLDILVMLSNTSNKDDSDFFFFWIHWKKFFLCFSFFFNNILFPLLCFFNHHYYFLPLLFLLLFYIWKVILSLYIGYGMRQISSSESYIKKHGRNVDLGDGWPSIELWMFCWLFVALTRTL